VLGTSSPQDGATILGIPEKCRKVADQHTWPTQPIRMASRSAAQCATKSGGEGKAPDGVGGGWGGGGRGGGVGGGGGRGGWGEGGGWGGGGGGGGGRGGGGPKNQNRPEAGEGRLNASRSTNSTQYRRSLDRLGGNRLAAVELTARRRVRTSRSRTVGRVEGSPPVKPVG